MELNDSIKTIKGIGDKTASAFARLGIETVNDLLLNYPRTYVTYEDPVDISDLQAGSRQSVRAVVKQPCGGQKSTWTDHSNIVRKGFLRDN